MRKRVGVALGVLIIVGLLGVAEPARADAIEITRLGFVGDALVAACVADLAPIDREIRSHADGELRRALPALFGTIDLGIVRFTNTRTEVSALRFEASSDPHVVVTTVTIEVRATREQRVIVRDGFRLSAEWRPTGDVHLATVSGRFEVRLTFPSPGTVDVGGTLKHLDATLHLDQLRVSPSVDLDRRVFSRSFDVPETPALGLRVRDGRVTSVQDQQLRFDLQLEPAE